MAILSVKRKPGTRRHTENDRSGWKYEQVYYVWTSDRTDDAQIVKNASGIPKMYDPYITPEGHVDTTAFVVNVEPKETESPYQWEVKVTWDSNPSFRDPDPLNRPPVITWSTERLEHVLWADQSGRSFTNSAGEIFDPLPTIERRLWVVSYQRNVSPPIDILTIGDYLDKINEEEWSGFPANSVKLDDYRTNTFLEGNIEFVSETYTFKIDTRNYGS